VVAPPPERVADHGLAAPGLRAQLLVGKSCDHLPFYRQEHMFWQRHGVFIARQQMGQWLAQCVRLLSGITDGLKVELRQRGYVQVDETPVRYQDPLREGRCGQGYLWTALTPGHGVVYEWHVSRAARCLESLLGPDFAGKLQSDGYAAYPAFAKGKDGLLLFGCWAHARRGFFEALAQAPQVAGWIVKQIGLLYRWEEECRQSRAGPGLRAAVRASHHRMVMKRLQRALIRLQPRYLPQSPLGQAISYALNQWPVLERILEHGEVELDNNLVENAIRPTALGKKNWLFFGSAEAGQRRAAAINGKIYAIGGVAQGGWEPALAVVEEYDPTPTVSLLRIGSTIKISWNGILESSDTANGAGWQALNPSTWPYVTPTSGPMKCYRARRAF